MTNTSRCGGVLAAINNELDAQQIELKPHLERYKVIENVDLLLVKIKFHKTILFILVMYIQPLYNNAEYQPLFECLATLDFSFNSDMLIVGNFNIPEYMSH